MIDGRIFQLINEHGPYMTADENKMLTNIGAELAKAKKDEETARRIISKEIQRNEELKYQIEMYKDDIERVWDLMPELRNTDSCYELFEAVHEKIEQVKSEVSSKTV